MPVSLCLHPATPPISPTVFLPPLTQFTFSRTGTGTGGLPNRQSGRNRPRQGNSTFCSLFFSSHTAQRFGTSKKPHYFDVLKITNLIYKYLSFTVSILNTLRSTQQFDTKTVHKNRPCSNEHNEIMDFFMIFTKSLNTLFFLMTVR
jgi:hypothetical protein